MTCSRLFRSLCRKLRSLVHSARGRERISGNSLRDHRVDRRKRRASSRLRVATVAGRRRHGGYALSIQSTRPERRRRCHSRRDLRCPGAARSVDKGRSVWRREYFQPWRNSYCSRSVARTSTISQGPHARAAVGPERNVTCTQRRPRGHLCLASSFVGADGVDGADEPGPFIANRLRRSASAPTSPDNQQLVPFSPGPLLLNNIENVCSGIRLERSSACLSD